MCGQMAWGYADAIAFYQDTILIGQLILSTPEVLAILWTWKMQLGHPLRV